MLRKIAATIATGSAILAMSVSAAFAAPSAIGEWYLLTWENNPRLIKIDKTTGAGTLIGTSSITVPDGLAGFDIDATNGVGYFVNYTGNNPKVYRVNLNNGAITEGAATTANNVTALDIGNNGEVWVAADDLNGVSQGFGRLNTTTGAVTNLAVPPSRIAALSTSSNGVLYAIDYGNVLWTINTSTYAFTQVGNAAGSGILASDFASDGRLVSMSWTGEFSAINVGTGASTALFTVSGVTGINTEAFAVAGPTNGQTLAEAIANPNASGGETLANTGSDLGLAVAGTIALVGGATMVFYARRKDVITK